MLSEVKVPSWNQCFLSVAFPKLLLSPLLRLIESFALSKAAWAFSTIKRTLVEFAVLFLGECFITFEMFGWLFVYRSRSTNFCIHWATAAKVFVCWFFSIYFLFRLLVYFLFHILVLFLPFQWNLFSLLQLNTRSDSIQCQGFILLLNNSWESIHKSKVEGRRSQLKPEMSQLCLYLELRMKASLTILKILQTLWNLRRVKKSKLLIHS